MPITGGPRTGSISHPITCWNFRIGSLASNPVKYNNHVHFFIGRNARKTAEPSPEPTELIEVGLKSLDEVYAAARRGEFVHPHHVAALFFAEPLLR